MEWPSGSLGLAGDFEPRIIPRRGENYTHVAYLKARNEFQTKKDRHERLSHRSHIGQGLSLLHPLDGNLLGSMPLPWPCVAGSIRGRRPAAPALAGREPSFLSRIASSSSSFPSALARRVLPLLLRRPRPALLCSSCSASVRS